MAKPTKQTNAAFVDFVSKKKAKKLARNKRLQSLIQKQDSTNRQLKREARDAKLEAFEAANARDAEEIVKLESFNRSSTGGTTLGDLASHTMWF